MASVNSLSLKDVAIIKARLAKGEFQHRIAADYDLNQGRICEIKNGQRWPNVKPYEDQIHA